MRLHSIINFVCVVYVVTGLVGCERKNQDGGRKQEVLKNTSNKTNRFSIKDGCTFPLTWRGLWTTRYHGNNQPDDSNSQQQQQRQLNNSMNITQREVKPLGTCVVSWRRELYLIAHNNGRCHVCLSISQVHEKVLQVKQSSCSGDDKEAEEAPRRDNTKERRKEQERKINEELFKDLCLDLGAEERFLTFIRGDVTAHPCPLTSPHHFVYSSPQGNCFCRSPPSYLHHCSDVTRLHFRLRKCKNCPETVEHEIEFVCLLRWKSPQDETAIGYSLSDPGMIFHSFVTKRVDSIIYATMFPTNNITSSHNKVMEFTMQLTEDTFGWSPSSCSFPDWLGSFRWSSFDSQLHFVFPSSEIFYNSSLSSSQQLNSFKLLIKLLDSDWPDLKGSANEWLTFNNSIFKCLTISNSNQSQNGSGVTSRSTSSTSIMTQVLTNCSSAYRCIHLQRHKVDSITLFRLGEKKIHLDEEGCEDEKWTGGWMLLVNTHILSEHCPFTGQYVGHDVIVLPDMTSSNCKVILKSGCPDPTSISISSPCGHTSVLLECISWWSDEAKIFLLTRNKFIPGVFQCYSFDPSNGEMLFQYEEYCQFAGHVIRKHQSPHNLSFTFKYELEPCSVQDELASWSKSHPLRNNDNNINNNNNNYSSSSNADHDSNKKQPQVTGNRIRESEMFPTSGHVSLISSHVMNDEKEWRGKNMRSPFLKERRPVVSGIPSALNCDMRRTCVILKTIATVAAVFVMTTEDWMVAV